MNAQMPTSAAPKHGSDTRTVAAGASVRVVVRPSYIAEHSDPERDRYVFTYHITILNEGETTVRLLSRYWLISDADGESHEVEGEGVIGEQPVIRPGHSHEYESFSPLATPWGTMEGHYTMVRLHPNTPEQAMSLDPSELGEVFEAKVGRFYLVSGQD
jgi:ApaG protein